MSANLATNMLQKHLRVLLQQHQQASFTEQKKALELAFWLILDQALGCLASESQELPSDQLLGFAALSRFTANKHQAMVMIERSMADSNHWLNAYQEAGKKWMPSRSEKNPLFDSAQIAVQSAPEQWPIEEWYQGFNALAEELRTLNQYD